MVQHLMLGYADLIWYSDGAGNPVTPAANLIENPNPLANTNNFYTRDGGGANFSNCSDLAQPGVAPIVNFLHSLPRPLASNCQQGRFYGLNNVSPQFNEDGTLKTLGSICNPFQYANDIMSDPVKRAAHIQDSTNLHEAIKTGTLPAIAFAKPDGIADGHPASSKLDILRALWRRS